MTQENIVKTIKILTVSAIAFLILLLSAMVITFVQLAAADAKLESLEAELSRLMSQSQMNEDEIAFRNTNEFIEQYAREYLNIKKDGESAFIGG